MGFHDSNRKHYTGKIAGDEKKFDSSDQESNESNDDNDEVPERRHNKKIAYDLTTEIPLWEVGLVFENAVLFREAIANYTVVRGVQLRVRPNERTRARAKCKELGCKWYVFETLEENTGNFVVKSYNLIHKCYCKNTNMSCTSKYLATHFKDKIISQPSIQLWKLQDLWKEQLKLYIGKTICWRAKIKVISQFMGDYKLEYGKL